jgi:hypothetical protein
MSMVFMAGLTATMVATAFLSGIFGMAGGLILMGVLLATLTLPEAMMLHAVTQMASNGWRGFLWIRYARVKPAAYFLTGSAIAFAVWSIWSYVPDKAVALVLLGASPFLVRLMPQNIQPDPNRLSHGILFGSLCMSLMLLAGVTGPLIDSYFLAGKFDRREMIATKALCQVASHGAKFVYFGGVVAGAASVEPMMAVLAVAASIVGTSLARPILERMSDIQYRTWATRIITVIALTYLARGATLFVH